MALLRVGARVLFLVVLLAGAAVPPAGSPTPVAAREPSPASCDARLFRAADAAADQCVSSDPIATAEALPSGFTESIALSGLQNPTAVEFAGDGRVFVAEKRGAIKVFDSTSDTTPTVFAPTSLLTNVQDYWDRGLLGLALDPSLTDPTLPSRPWVYVLYTYDHILGSAAAPPRWGDACPSPPGPTTDGCVVSARLSRFSVSGTTISGPETVLIEDWCQQYPSHSIGALAFGPDGALYVSGGDGASFDVVDYGQLGGSAGSPTGKNPCGDPPNDSMTPPTAEGGALRSQDLRTGGATGPSYQQVVVSDSPIAYWRLGESAGTVADDSVGTNDGAYIGGYSLNQPGALAGDSNGAVGLDGSTGFIRAPQLTLPGSITLEAWARPVAYPGDTALVGQWDGTRGPMLYLTSDFGGRVYLWINGTSMSAPAPATGAWHHFVGTYDGTSGRIFVDGVLVAGPTALPGPLVTAPRALEMGTYNNGGGGKFNGRIDEVAIYATALTGTRVQAHYTAGASGGGGSSDPTTLDGAILRVDPVTGAAFSGNPFASSPDPNKQRVIAYGLRNPFRFAMRPGTNELWLGDVGWGRWEEINRIANISDGVVENFGWPCYEGGPRQGGYDAANVSICEDLYSAGTSAVSAPIYAYDHSVSVVAGDGCPTGSSAIAGVEFYPESGGNFPTEYRGALFFADHNRGCIWWMRKGANGQPDPSTRAAFVAPAASPVDLEVGSDGSLYYVDFGGGTVRRVSYTSGNQPPTAVAQANPTAGAAPLTVNFSAASSTDPESGALTYAWDLDGDGLLDDSTSATPTWTYNVAGNVTVRLRVTDPQLATDDDTVVISVGNTPPVPVISSPASGTTWSVGQLISFAGSATDAQDGTIPASRLAWTLTIQHCPSDCHPHIIQEFPAVASGQFNAPDHEYPSYLELTLTATDSNGLQASTTRILNPRTVTLSLESSPTGLQLALNGTATTSPITRTVIESSVNTVSAPSPQSVGNVNYSFQSWSDGGTATHTIVATTSSTLTATFSVSGMTRTTVASADAEVRWNKATTNYGTGTTLRVRSGQYRTYLKFDVPTFSGLQSAKLRVFVVDGGRSGGNAYVVSNAWTETGITWNNAPAITGSAVASLGSAVSGQWLEVDVTSAVSSGATVSFAITDGSNDAVDYSSRTGAQPPQLVITSAS